MNCLGFARLVSVDLSPHRRGIWVRLQFWAHWLLCSICRAYRKELEDINLTHRMNSHFSRHYSGRLDDLKRRLNSRVRVQLSRV